jgi:serine acetyltransferase
MIGMGCVIKKKTTLGKYKKYAGNPAVCIGENTNNPNYANYKNRFS